MIGRGRAELQRPGFLIYRPLLSHWAGLLPFKDISDIELKLNFINLICVAWTLVGALD